jgi:kynurenine formamidase
MALIDMTHPVTSRMQVFPRDRVVHLHDALVLNSDGV